MDRRDFMRMCGVVPVSKVVIPDIVEVSASNVAITHEDMMECPDNEIKGKGTWWLKKAGDSITIKLLGKDFYCEVRMENFSENVDYVQSCAPRKKPSPAFEKFAVMFGFQKGK